MPPMPPLSPDNTWNEPGEIWLAAEIDRLAGLDPKKYYAESATRAQDLGMSVSDLDELVLGRRKVAVLKPELTRDLAGFKDALRVLDVEFRYNLRAGKAEMRRNHGPWHELNDRKESALCQEIEAKFTTMTTRGLVPMHLGQQRRRDLINALLDECEVDPFLEYLNALPAWDGVSRISFWMSDLFDVDAADPLVQWASQFVFLGAVWRADKPGTKLDEMPVFAGPQGIGKSTALRLALPPEYVEWFADGLHLAAPSKERAEALQGRVIVEASEMAGSGRADMESLKTFITQLNDGVQRLAYRRNPETMLRRCIIVGTTNLTEFLPNDPSGNRRFVPVDLKDGDPTKIEGYMKAHREQMWAEAVALYHEGKQAWLPRDLHDTQRETAECYRRSDDFIEDLIADLSTHSGGMTLAEIAVECNLIDADRDTAQLDMRTQHRLGQALNNAGWEKRRSGAGKARKSLWFPPNSSD